VNWERLLGRVIGAKGEPVAEAMVAVVEATAPVPEIALVTDEDGRFALGVRPGTYRLRATTRDGRRGDGTWSSDQGGTLVIRLSD
jgi:hypothetical protein